MPSDRQRIEDAVGVYLQGELLYLRAIEPYNGEIDRTDGPEHFRRRIRGRSPIILTSAMRGTLESRSVQKTLFTRAITLELYMVSNHNRTRENRLRTDVVAESDTISDPGIYQMLEDCERLLAGQDLGLSGVAPMMPAEEDVLIQEDDITIVRQVYNIRTDAHVFSRGYAADKLLEYQINSNLVDDDGETVLDSPPNPIAESDESGLHD